MNKIHRSDLLPLLLILTLLSWGCSLAQDRHTCPIGYTIAYNNNDPICYRLKGPEKFADQFQDCAGNLYTTKLYYNFSIPNPNKVLWTEYKTMYRGGPIIDWSYTDSIGEVDTSSNVNYDPAMAYEEACIVVDRFKQFTAVKCDEEHYRYCFFKPFISRKDDTEGCEDFVGSTRFYSPIPTCLAVERGNFTGNVSQAEKICGQRGGTLLNKGWIYAKDPLFYYKKNRELKFAHPLLVSADANGDSKNYPTWRKDPGHVISSSKTASRGGTRYFALLDNTWHWQPVPPNSFNFTHRFLCERRVHLKQVMMSITVTDYEEKIILTLNETVNINDIKCFTDSVTYYPVNVRVTNTYDEYDNNFVLSKRKNGHYWCVLTNSRNYIVTESKKEFIFTRLIDINKPLTAHKPTEDKDRKDTIYIIQCINDSNTNDLNVNVTFDENANDFRLSPSNSSYYLCFATDLIHTEPIKVLFIRDNDSFVKYHAVMIHVIDEQKHEDLHDNFKDLKDYKDFYSPRKLEEYGMTYMNMFGLLLFSVKHISEQILSEFMATPNWRYMDKTLSLSDFIVDYYAVKMKFKTEHSYRDFIDNYLGHRHTQIERQRRSVHRVTHPIRNLPPELQLEDNTVFEESHKDDQTSVSNQIKGFMESMHKITVKKCVYGKEVLFHARLNPLTTPPPLPVTWDKIEVVSIKPVNYCNLNGSIFPRGDSFMSSDCRTFTCVGDFNEGVELELVTTASTGCPTTNPPTTTIPLQQDDLLQQVLKDMKTLLQKTTVQMEDIGETFDKVDKLLKTRDNLEIPGILLHKLDELASCIDLNGSTSAIAERASITLLVANSKPSDPVRGLRLPVKIDDNSNDTAEVIYGAGDINTTLLTAQLSEAVVGLPKSTVNSTRKIKFIIFANDRAFNNDKSAVHYSVNSRILSISIDNLTQFDIGETVDIYMKPIKHDRDDNRSCAYWHFLEDGNGYWSQEGCTFTKSIDNGVLDVCRCNHLTHFAEILIPRSGFIQIHEDILELLSIIGCCLSIFGICMVGVTAAVFRSWRREYTNKIWLQLCVAIFLLITCFMITIFLKFDHDNNIIICTVVGVALHYSVLASFCWMLVAAVLSYRRLVIVFTRDASHKLLRASAFSWGAPCAVVGVLLSVDPHSYAGQFEDKALSGAFCYPSGLGLWLAVYTPIAVMLLANWTLFALIVRSLFSRKIQRHGGTNEAVKCASTSSVLVFLFGLPWIFGLFAHNIVAAYLFTLTATYQGFVLFLFIVIGIKSTRELWLNKFNKKRRRRQVLMSSSTSKTPTGVTPKVLGTRMNPESY